MSVLALDAHRHHESPNPSTEKNQNPKATLAMGKTSLGNAGKCSTTPPIDDARDEEVSSKSPDV